MEAEAHGLQSRVLGGVAWKFGSTVFSQITRMATAVILARLLAPHDYGVAGMVLVISSLVYILSDMALGTALVQRRELSEEDRSTVFWTSAAAGAMFTLVGVALSGPVASFYGEPAVKTLFAVFSLNFFVTSLASTQSALLTREMDFKALELRKMTAFAVGAVIGITLAATGFGPWAIIAQQLGITVTSTILLVIFAPWRPRFVFSFARLRRLSRFSGNVVGTQLLFFTNRNLDNLLVGRYLGAAALGSYAIAYNVMLMPFSQIASPIQEVLFPAFSRLQDDHARIAATWLRVNRVVATLTIPGLVGLAVVAPDLVAVVLGNRWHGATAVIQILSWVGLLQSLQRFNSSILEARNRTGTLLLFALIAATASAVAFVVGLRWGIIGVAAGYALASTLVEPLYTWMTAKSVGITLGDFLRSLRGIAKASLVMGACVLAARLALVRLGVPAAGRLPVVIVIGFLTYVPLCMLLEPEMVKDLRGLRRRRSVRAQVVPATD